jgi:hypothetical protein
MDSSTSANSGTKTNTTSTLESIGITTGIFEK